MKIENETSETKQIRRYYAKELINDISSSLCVYMTTFGSEYDSSIINKMLDKSKKEIKRKMKEKGKLGRIKYLDGMRYINLKVSLKGCEKAYFFRTKEGQRNHIKDTSNEIKVGEQKESFTLVSLDFEQVTQLDVIKYFENKNIKVNKNAECLQDLTPLDLYNYATSHKKKTRFKNNSFNK